MDAEKYDSKEAMKTRRCMWRKTNKGMIMKEYTMKREQEEEEAKHSHLHPKVM